MYKHKRTSVVIASVMLAIMTGCSSAPSQRSAGQTLDDGVVATKVKSALIANDQTKARQIDVEVYKGEVQLNGFVDSNAAKMAAADTAKNVEGVQSVKNNLQVSTAERSAGDVVDDTVITARVKSALVGDPRTKAMQIEVDTNNGMVQLGGFVDSAAGKAAAAELASGVEGVKGVKNAIEVRQ